MYPMQLVDRFTNDAAVSFQVHLDITKNDTHMDIYIHTCLKSLFTLFFKQNVYLLIQNTTFRSYDVDMIKSGIPGSCISTELVN